MIARDEFAKQEDIEAILKYHTMAIVGLSPDPFRPSHVVASYLKRHGYRIVPVNPYVEMVLGEKAYPDLASIPFPVDVVVIFRRSDAAGKVVDEAIQKGVKAVWMQEGVIDDLAALRARRAGIRVVMDRCILKEHAYLAHQPIPVSYESSSED
ncbi:CoA-binding domain protein [Thermobaculum terrenum ATCC BAA-798]|uniref:CoA-binding domain protein n=1 Tax=Thermobaculum terrenum (strain ATCC BAA-798 / CCMEE 7001 / YNP1) TaxID=525904 RepID=D1CG45_THET1|nr:CoA-binding protein [Thermobaculum terrenum]ACZ41901.1 CoA-binding domain protein [Thermobaculum terrenum ATCC BAA-798]